ncbi:MAG: 4Fe-4S dicluster domain-containing protein [Deltaproteobacteria bacterium]|nr:4Fe-4S dicluster domain-containing protein [Deltaproteobacteria bacterium]MBW2069860.1 4Fe-4S dicluster domain-containing protein [Deltaproteobacteria bacterium]
MNIGRRSFFKIIGAAAGVKALNTPGGALAAVPPKQSAETLACLVDTTVCVGCRKCEEACNARNKLAKPAESFEEMTVLESPRRPNENSYTVVNKYYPQHIGSLTWRKRPVYVKFQCMHCNDPSCASACIVGALHKVPQGPVVYDVSKCIGCRYCMVACPFQIPAYEYHNPLTPEVRKCTFCFAQVKDGGLPACAQVCPMEAITFGRRSELLQLARWKMKENPGKYVDHIYGEQEVGGTSWLYLASEPFETIGFPRLGTKPPPRLTETIQHGLFRYFAAPVGLYVLLGGIMWATGFYGKYKDETKKSSNSSEQQGGAS